MAKNSGPKSAKRSQKSSVGINDKKADVQIEGQRSHSSQTKTPIEDRMIVGLIYTLKDNEGQLIEERTVQDPLLYIHGFDQIIPLIEEAVENQTIGFSTTVYVRPQDYYGDYDAGLVQSLLKKDLPQDWTPEVGDFIEVENDQGQTIEAQVVEVEKDKIVIDGNHPLAGLDLVFQLQVKSVRLATAAELEQGYPEGSSDDDRVLH